MWSYKREESNGFKPIPEGAHRIRIASAEMAKAKTGKDMLTLKFDVSGYPGFIFHNIVYLPDRPEITNRSLTSLFDSFKDIGDGNFNLSTWTGKVGAAYVANEEYNGNTNAKIKYFLKPEKAAGLAPWKEPERKDKSQTSNNPVDADGFLQVSTNDDDLPPF